MARLESRSEQVKPQDEQETISRYEDFGWTLQGSQEVVDNYLSTSGGTTYQNRSKYVKLMFQRDKDMPNYQDIARLDSQYTNEYNRLPTVGNTSAMREIILMISGIFLFPLFFVGLILLLKKKKGVEKKWAEGYAKIQPLRAKAKELQ